MERIGIACNPFAHLFEDHIVYQMESIVSGLADKSEYHIERNYQNW